VKIIEDHEVYMTSKNLEIPKKFITSKELALDEVSKFIKELSNGIYPSNVWGNARTIIK
jgi:hypothetical protein